VLEQVRAARLPIQVLVNKADRLAAADLEKVMTMVNESLATVGIESWSPPRALSAKRALKGKLGDAAALAESGWPEVEAMLEREIIGKSDILKERALRRRAARVVMELGARAAEIAQRDEDEAARLTAAAHAMSLAAARLDREGDEASRDLETALVAPAAAWQAELHLVETGRDAKTTTADPLLARYRTERALALLAPPLAEAMARLAASPALVGKDLTPVARSLVRAFVARPGAGAMALLARAALGALVEHVSALAVADKPRGLGGGRVRELMALSNALHAE